MHLLYLLYLFYLLRLFISSALFVLSASITSFALFVSCKNKLRRQNTKVIVKKKNEKTISFFLTCEKGNSPKKILFFHERRKIEFFFLAVKSEKRISFLFT